MMTRNSSPGGECRNRPEKFTTKAMNHLRQAMWRSCVMPSTSRLTANRLPEAFHSAPIRIMNRAPNFANFADSSCCHCDSGLPASHFRHRAAAAGGPPVVTRAYGDSARNIESITNKFMFRVGPRPGAGPNTASRRTAGPGPGPDSETSTVPGP
jgi:hypothetical protein